MPWRYWPSKRRRTIKRFVRRVLLLGTLLVVFWVVYRAIEISNSAHHPQGYF